MNQDRDRSHLLQRLVDAALERNGEDVLVLDVREVTSFADVFVIVTGRSDRNVHAIVDAMLEALRELGEKPLGVEGYEEGRWVLVDDCDVIVHVFQPEAREEYQLERLYDDASVVELVGAAARGSAR